MKKLLQRGLTRLMLNEAKWRPICPALGSKANRSTFKILPGSILKTYSTSVDSSTRGSEFQKIVEPFRVLPVLAPAFPAIAADINLITQPKIFFHEIKKKIESAKKRITIASLYIGHGEHEIIEALEKALEKNKELEVSILLDCLRGTRETQGASSASLLLPLVKLYPDRFRLSMYHTPELTGWMKKLGPPRFNETIGLMHIKAYLFDEDVILSGANLSKDYFQNRQDRYYVFNNNISLSHYFHTLIQTISDFSYRVRPSAEGHRLSAEDSPDPVYESPKFKEEATSRMVDFLLDIRDPFSLDSFASLDPNCDTVVVPVVQMGQLNILQDQRITLEILQAIHSAGRTKAGIANRYSAAITSGYFNFNKLYQDKILQTSALFDIITASPEANGFFGSKGVSKYIPDAYTIIEDAFISKALGANRFRTIKVEEYARPDWTYHAKGFWLKQPGEETPFLTSIGSPNFGYRSLERDLEAQVFLITANPRLRHDMQKELDNIRKYVSPITEEKLSDARRTPRLFARIATPLVRSML